MGRFSRVKGGCGKKSEAPDLEAHFSDGAWYDIVLRAADPTRNRFLVQARDFPDEEEWLEADRVRPQSQPFEDLPKEGSVVLALHRSQRSDLFFEGVVTDSGPSSFCKVKFTEGRAKGSTVKSELDDVNKISSKRCSADDLRRWCPRKEASAHKSVEVVSLQKGAFVLIEGPDDSCWVAQLLEPYTGKLSEEVDDVDDDGPRISLRWLYTPDELPSNVLKGLAVDKEHEVFLSFHKDSIDARLIKGKCSCVFGFKRPRAGYKWSKDEMFSCRTWDPVKKKISSMDCPLLCTEFRSEVDRLVHSFPLPEACRADKDKERGAAGGEAASAGGAGAGTASRARHPEGRSEDHGVHDGGSAAEAGEGEAKRHERGRKGRASGEALRASQDVVAERRGQQASQTKADDAGTACAEGDAAAGAERRKSTRASGVGCDGGVGASAGDAGNGGNGEAEVGLRRRSKGGGVQSDKEAEEARPPDEVRDAKTERKGRGSKGQQESNAAEAKADARGNESKDAKDDVKKGKRKLDAGDVKVEKPAAAGVLQAEQDKTEGKSEGEGDGEERKLRAKDAKDDAQVLDKDDDKHDKKSKKGKRDSRDDKDKDRDKDKSAGAAPAPAAPCADKGGVESAATVEKPPDKGREKSRSKEELEQQEDVSKLPADRKQEGSQREEPTRPGAGQAQARGKESKEKKRSSAARGSWELAALQADVSKSDMLSSIADTGKRRVVPATYFTYDDTGNQAELTKDMHKNVLNVHKSPDRGEAQQRVKARELAGPGVEASRGRRGAVDTPVQEEAPRRERQVPDRYEVAPAPKAKRAKGAAASAGGTAGVAAALSSGAAQPSAPAKSSGGSRRGVTGAAGKETQGGDAEAGGDKRQSRDSAVAGSRAAAVPCDEQAKPDKGVGGAAGDGDGLTSMDHGSGARAKGCKATALSLRKEEKSELAGEDASDSHAARASRKRAARKEDDGGVGDGAHGGQGSGAGAGGLDEAGGGSGAPKKKKGRSSAAAKDQAAGSGGKDASAASALAAMSASARLRDEHGGAAATDAQPHAADDSELDTSRLGQTDDEARGDEDEQGEEAHAPVQPGEERGGVAARESGDAEMESKAEQDDDESEDEGVGIVPMRDEGLAADALWRFDDASACCDQDAIKGFLLETLRHACADFLRHREYKATAYFLHPVGAGATGDAQRALSSVNVALGFRSKGSNQECHECLRAFASEKQATALVLVVEDSQVRHPRVGSQVAKSVGAVEGAEMQQGGKHRGLLIQLDSDQQRRVWHVIYKQQGGGCKNDTNTRAGQAPSAFDGAHGQTASHAATSCGASNQSSNQGAIASEDKPAPDQDNKAMRDAVKGDDGDVSKTARNPGPQAGAPERAQERAQDVEMPDAAGSGGDEKPQEAAEGQEVHADKRELADSATGAGGGEARGTGARTLCLRELDVHKCAIMPPVINAT